MIHAPQFWTKKNHLSYLLLPLSLFYFLGFLLIRLFNKRKKISKPVICIGNLVAGGAGKTPVAIAIGKILQEMHINFAFLSRGYMNDGSKFLLLKKGENFDAKKVGDEPLLLSENATTFVAKNRFFGAAQIERMKNFQAIILDDGLQNNSLFFDYGIMVVDANLAFGNEFMIPAGPMREPLKLGLKKIDLVIVIGELTKYLKEKLRHKKIIKAEIIPTNLSEFKNKKLFAFAGIAYPEKFFATLKKNNLNLVQTKSFIDHYSYKKSDLEKLLKEAEKQDAKLITTKKDWVKFSAEYKEKIAYLDIAVKFENEEILKTELKKIL